MQIFQQKSMLRWIFFMLKVFGFCELRKIKAGTGSAGGLGCLIRKGGWGGQSTTQSLKRKAFARA